MVGEEGKEQNLQQLNYKAQLQNGMYLLEILQL